MVRLKVYVLFLASLAFCCFNSSMVRLKDRHAGARYIFHYVFQFQYGAIKSPRSFWHGSPAPPFQFQYGAIKSVFYNAYKSLNTVFQFQYGAIKSIPDLDVEALRESFNSSMVRLKAREKIKEVRLKNTFQFQYGAIKSRLIDN